MNLIVAIDQNGIIGDGNKMLWYIPEDLRRFRILTIYNIIIMGRKTFESLNKEPLELRLNIVLTRHPEKYKNIENKLYFVKEEQLENFLKNPPEIYRDKKVFVIGGNEIYKKLYTLCRTIYITIVYRKDSIINKNSVFFECDIKDCTKIYESGLFLKKDIEYEYFVYKKNS
jgi:dihydrofolate reductase